MDRKVPGGAKGIRTPDLLNAIQTLSQLSYSPTAGARSIPASPPAPTRPHAQAPPGRFVAWQHPVVRARVVTSTVEESIARIELRGGPLAVRIRRTPRARGLRITIHPVHGPVVSLPPATRRGWGRADADI